MQNLTSIIRYWITRFFYHLRYNKLVHRVQIEIEIRIMFRRLRRKDYSADKIINIMTRYLAMKKLCGRKETRESRIELNQAIAEISDRTGVPQWQLRDKVRNDFKIDI